MWREWRSWWWTFATPTHYGSPRGRYTGATGGGRLCRRRWWLRSDPNPRWSRSSRRPAETTPVAELLGRQWPFSQVRATGGIQLPFPLVGQIPTGAHEDSITGKYGDPQALCAVTSTGGHMVETMVYARTGRSATVIRIKDGKVSSAYTQTEPVVPPGMSAPRRWHNE